MPFMLDSFTSGLFGGANDAFNIVNQWQRTKQEKMETQRQQDLMTAGKQVKQAMNTQSTAAPPITVTSSNVTTPATGSTATTTPNSAPSGSTAPLNDNAILAQSMAQRRRSHTTRHLKRSR
jgi:hypothetical protein